MDWYIVLALAVPFLFVIGVIYNALKEQKVLEDGQLKKVLTERKAKGLAPAPADDDDDYGLPERQDLKRAAARAAPPSSAAAPASVPPRHQPLGNTEAKNAASYFAQYYQAEQIAPTESQAAETAESQTEEATAPERAAK